MLLADGSIWRLRDLRVEGINARVVGDAVAEGTVELLSRGVYRKADADQADGFALAEVAIRIPDGVICLMSAADRHRLTEIPTAQVWVAIPHHRAPPRLDFPPVRAVWSREDWAFKLGIEEIHIHGVPVRMTSPARTVVDFVRRSRDFGPELVMSVCEEFIFNGGNAREVSKLATKIGLTKAEAFFMDFLTHMEQRHDPKSKRGDPRPTPSTRKIRSSRA